MLATTVQVGYALGVVVTGLLFFARADDSVADAFEASMLQLGALGLAMVLATRLLPARTAAAVREPAPAPAA